LLFPGAKKKGIFIDNRPGRGRKGFGDLKINFRNRGQLTFGWYFALQVPEINS
jgi:hypothetical protein